MQNRNIEQLLAETTAELRGNILPYWMDNVVFPDGMMIGRIDGAGNPHPDAPLGLVMVSRILWTFSRAFRLLGEGSYLRAADTALNYLTKYFSDNLHGGYFWSVTRDGTPLDDRKQTYGQAFALYGMIEYEAATGTGIGSARLFGLIRERTLDVNYGGYTEAFSRDWSPVGDMRLSEKDMNLSKTMNTHLHVLEAFTNFYRFRPCEDVKHAITDLLEIFRSRIFNPKTGHFGLFFSTNWAPGSSTVSYGHDIEAVWLLREAIHVAGIDAARYTEMLDTVAEGTWEGVEADGSLVYEYDPATGLRDDERHWWPQAENVVGSLDTYLNGGDGKWLERAIGGWNYIKSHLTDPAGEWFWSAEADGCQNRVDDKAGFWKCPYHNSRMVFEIMERLGK